MLEVADPAWAPWYIARSDDKERARLNGLSHFLSLFPCEPVPQPKVKLPKRPKEHVYDGETPMKNRCWIQEKY